MDLQKTLIESKRQKSDKRSWKATIVSLVLHGTLIAGVVYAGTQTTHKVASENKPIAAFITRGAAPPPPPPPPPPAPAASQSAPSTPKPVKQQPVRVKPQPFTQPREIPKDVPKVKQVTPEKIVDLTTNETPIPQPDVPSDSGSGQTAGADAANGVPGGVQGGVAGGVVGGVAGGVVGGEIGGTVGGEIGGVQGGVVGGKVGGVVGGQGTGTGGTGSGGDDAPEGIETKPKGPLRVGGDVKAPVATDRVDPEYTEVARKSRVAGLVIVEAVINKHGRVEQVRVVKGLPMGLSEAAERAVRQWRFKPGTLNGQPVDTIFNLTVNFKLD
ncbi:MAG TPA: energy transducer TonB [Thermoanaerobaculia bacterium]|jgi:protein TonB